MSVKSGTNSRPIPPFSCSIAFFICATFNACTVSPSDRLANACRAHEFECADFVRSRAQLLLPARTNEAPYDAEAGTCGPFKYLRHRQERVPTDQQESISITRFYGDAGTLIGARVANNYDSSGTFKSHIDYGEIPTCKNVRTEILTPLKN